MASGSVPPLSPSQHRRACAEATDCCIIEIVLDEVVPIRAAEEHAGCREARLVMEEARHLSPQHACMILSLPAMGQDHVLLTHPPGASESARCIG